MPKKKDSKLRNRVIEYIKDKGMSIRAFEESLKFPNGSISQYTDNTSRDTLKKIYDMYPDFDIDYIITGRKNIVDTEIYKQTVPYEFVEALIEERKRHDEERKRHDEMNAELIRQNGSLIRMLEERENGLVQNKGDASCADVSESGLGK